MRAYRLEYLLTEAAHHTEIPHRSHNDLQERFQRLRSFRLLPDRKSSKQLTASECAAGILSIVSPTASYAAVVARSLLRLKPVGGEQASFSRSASFEEAMSATIEDDAAFNSLLEVRASPSEFGMNSYCCASISYLDKSQSRKIAYYLPESAYSARQPGAETSFDPLRLTNNISVETVLPRQLLARIRNSFRQEDLPSLAEEDPQQDDQEQRQLERAQYLGLTRSSRFLNLGVDNQVTWPNRETLVQFEGVSLVLMPKQGEYTTSIHVDLVRNNLSDNEAHTLVNRFLSMLSWCDDQYAIIQDGFAGNPIPLPVHKRNLAFTTAHHWHFKRKSPQSSEARKAIAIFREARGAQQNYLVSYAVLAYYKIIEIRHGGKSEARTWFRDNFPKLRQYSYLNEQVARFEKECGTEKPHDYLYRACRTAVAHANKPFSSDPDDFDEIRRLHVAAGVLHPLAREFIQNELGVSTSHFDGT